jgi:hypothetical protein
VIGLVTLDFAPLLPKGRSHTQTFVAPGVYADVCGLHPPTKGTIAVK